MPSRLLVDVEALAPQRERDDVEHAGIVVDDEDARVRGHAGTASRTDACSSTIAHARALAGRGVELDAPVEAAHGLPHDREAEPEALGVAVLTAVEAVEHVPLRVGRHADAGVLDLHAQSVADAYARNTT